MEIVNLLNFLNKAKELSALDYASCSSELINILNLITDDEQFTQKIDLGLVYLRSKTLDQYVVVDGLNRLLSLSLLLHAVCECYKKTSSKNDSAIETIRSKYLVDGASTKLRLPAEYQDIYHKIIFGERLSGKEKESQIFILLHNYWLQIKEDGLQAGRIFKMLQKIFVILVDTNDVPQRELYYTLNKDNRDINQLLLIENYLKNIGLLDEWNNLKSVFANSSADLKLFFKDFFTTKFNFKTYKEERLYEVFVNYIETMLQYMPEDLLIKKIKRTATLYRDLLNVSVQDENIRRALIQIKMHRGEDTFAYILNIYEDYVDSNISEATFVEILQTIDEYLRNRIKTPNIVAFNDLINYLNAFITCK